jgi:hypothetical protein
MSRTKLILWVAGLCLPSLALVGTASATCSIDLSSFKPHSGHTQQSVLPTGLIPAVFHPDAAGGAHLISVNDSEHFPPSIVGLWRFQFSPELGGDFGTVIWHEDGTEIMISAARDPPQVTSAWAHGSRRVVIPMSSTTSLWVTMVRQEARRARRSPTQCICTSTSGWIIREIVTAARFMR